MKIAAAVTIFFLGSACALAQEGSFNPRDSASIEREEKRIRETYKNDPQKLFEELDRFNRTVSKALGTDKTFAAMDARRLKYGNPSSLSILESLDHDRGHKEPVQIDHEGWKFEVKEESGELAVTFRLDAARYKDARPSRLRVQLRRKEPGGNRSFLARWSVTPNTFRANLTYEAVEGGAYQTRFAVPAGERENYSVQVYADIEPGWGAEGVAPLKESSSPHTH